MESAGVESSKWTDAILSIDKLEKQGRNEVMKELEQKGINDNSIAKIFGMIQKKENNKETINNLKLFLKEGIGKEGLEEIIQILDFLKSFNVKAEVDPSLARGLSYYTGPVFEVFLDNSEIKSAIAGGGRYDNMISDLLSKKEPCPATGISFGLELITDVLKNKVEKKSVVKVYLIPIRTEKECVKIAVELRKEGINTDMDLVGRGISKNLDFANSQKIPFVLFVGQKELEQKKVKLRDMKTGKEQLLTMKQAVQKLKS